MTDAAPPGDLRVVIDGGTRLLDGGRVVAGGHPLRVLRLTDDGARAVAGWREPSPVGADPARRALARRLLDGGVLQPRPAPARAGLTVIVPVRDRPRQLARCLDALVAHSPDAALVVVDDGSADARAVQAAAAPRGAAVLRHPSARGPAAARNLGLRACGTPFVAFVDSDVVVTPGWAAALLGHLVDPAVAAVAPRVLALPGARGLIGGYETRHSALDMGPAAGLVAPGRPVSYVPSAVLVARRAALGAGFDEALRVGEDVDLVWRLAHAGMFVRYEPDVCVRHDHRTSLRGFVGRRREYATSVAVLARRHPGAVPALRLNAWTGPPWALLLAGRPRAALAAAAAATAVLTWRLDGRPSERPRLAAALMARGLMATGRGVAQAVRRAWAPVLLPTAARHPVALRILAAAYAAPVIEDAARTRRPGTAAGDAAVRLLDEIVALVGTWEGCLRQRTAAPLLPAWGAPARRSARDATVPPRSTVRP